MPFVKSLAVGNGDMYYITHASDNFSIIDCYLLEDIRSVLVKEIKHEADEKGVVRFISTHPDEDHLAGLAYLDEQLSLRNFYCVKNEAIKEDESDSFKRYRSLRDSDKAYYIYKGCSRRWMNESSEKRGHAGLHILWPDRSNTDYQDALESARQGISYNNISTVIQYIASNNVKMLWLGDLETDFMDKIEAYTSALSISPRERQRMLDAFKLFDVYSLRARLFPALIVGLPTLALLSVLVPWDHLGLPHAIAGSVGAILLFAFADVARWSGKRVEEKLGTRASPQLLHENNSMFDQASKARYKGFLATRLGTKAPTAQEEIDDPAKANQFYLSAGNWLREQTRDIKKFKILFDELITYGFRRNLLGLKPIALFLNLWVMAVALSILYFKWGYFYSIENVEAKLWIVIVAAMLHSGYMGFAVGKASVWEASQSYGRQLILSIETFIAANGGAVAKPRRPSKQASNE